MTAAAVDALGSEAPREGAQGAGKGFHFTDRDFRTVVRLVAELSGIALAESKRDMVYARLGRRLRQLGLQRFEDYLEQLEDPRSEELVHFVNALTTNLTAFFREPHHFDVLEQTLLPEIKARGQGGRIRIWSAGCSTGEEPYSIAIRLLESLPDAAQWDIRILATDIDTQVVEHAARGVYDAERIGNLKPEQRRRWFRRGRGPLEGKVRVVPELQELIRFRPLNLMGDWPMRGPLDAIFCRNVVIYFDKDTQRRLFERYANLMVDDGLLFIGHSETLFRISERFKPLGGTVYRKCR